MNPYIVMAKLNTNYHPHRDWSLFNGRFLKYQIGGALMLLLILGIFYILEINKLAILGYDIKKSDKNYQLMKKDMEKLQLEIEKMRIITNLRQKAQSLNMLESKKISYIDISSDNLVFYDKNINPYK